ncbi:D-xylose ABC transporter ATP-binding protein, partial [Rhizobiaceae sp. 2RAB30]
PDDGEIQIDGERVTISGPSDAMALGIRTVYQEFSLLPHLSVAENILLGRIPTRGLPFVVDWEMAHEIAARALGDFGFGRIDP